LCLSVNLQLVIAKVSTQLYVAKLNSKAEFSSCTLHSCTLSLLLPSDVKCLNFVLNSEIERCYIVNEEHQV
jgi:hypothetical protein